MPTDLTWDSLRQLVIAGETDWAQYGDVRGVDHDGLLLLNYTNAAQFANRWNWFESVSRGLILDRATGATVALPFAKFHNYYDGCTSAPLIEATEKLDGSLGILYRHQGQHKIATRGSFTSDQALWATEYLNHRYDLSDLPACLTLLFEIIYPENRVVVDYGTRQDLVLIGIRNTETLSDYSASAVLRHAELFKFPTPTIYAPYPLSDLIDRATRLTAHEEGYVLRFADGTRWKVKGDAYKLAHKLMTGVSFRRVLEAVQFGRLDLMIANVPDEFLTQINAWHKEIIDTVAAVNARVVAEINSCPKTSRKEFALHVNQHYPTDQRYLFALLDGRPIVPLIYRHAFADRLAAEPEEQVL